MQKYSFTYTAAIASLLASLTFLSEADALNLVNAVTLVATFIGVVLGRWRAGGLKNILGFK